MTTREYYQRAAIDGRAVLRYFHHPGESGQAQPQFWLCEVGQAIVACDSCDFLVDANKCSVDKIMRRWRQHLLRRRDDRRRLRRGASRLVLT